MKIIVAENLTKKFGKFTAVDNISFKVERGEIFGFLGANGAGKTTAMRMLCGLSKPTSGKGEVAGFDIEKDSENVKKSIGYMSQKFALYEDLKVWENLRLYAGIYGVPEKQIDQKTNDLLVQLGFEKEKNTMVKSLPLGWKQKLAFSTAIFHDPKIVFLDEPTGGVDPATRRQFWELIYNAADRGITIFVTTHYMDEAEYCNRVSIMVDGRIDALDSPKNLKQQYDAKNMDEVFQQLARQAKEIAIKMRQFLVFTQKEFYHIFRDRWTMVMLLALPMVMIILFGFGITTEIRNSKIAIFDPSKDIATQEIVNKLETSEYFSLLSYLDSPNQIETVFKKGEIGLVVVFSENFYENLLHTGDAQVLLIADGSDPNTAATLTSYVSNIITMYQKELLKIDQIPYQIKSEVKLLYNPTMKGAYSIVPGVMGMVLMLICALMTSVSLAKEKELGTMEVILVSPMPPLMIILSKVVPYFVISVVNFINVLLLSVFLLNVPIAGSLVLLCFISIIFILVALSLGLLISSIVDKQLVALLISAMGLMMPVVMLSGLMFPIENMPIILQGVAQIIPAKWYIEAVRAVMIKGLGLFDVLQEIGILSLMAVVLISVSLQKFKIRLE